MVYSTVVQIEEENPKKEDIRKFILCDLQIDIFSNIQKTFINILKLSGFPQVNISGSVDFVKLYEQKINQK